MNPNEKSRRALPTVVSPVVNPCLKWPGGKRWLAPVLADIMKRELAGRYFEPFLGGAAVFLTLRPRAALLADINHELIEFYRVSRRQPEAVVEAAWRFRNDEDGYYAARSSRPRTTVGRAARFLFLNKTCWGGIYRLNRVGEFNVPFGRSGRHVCSRQSVRAVADALKTSILRCSDFEAVIEEAVEGDGVYADPPYTTKGENNGFVRYNEKLFAWEDQERLARVCRKAGRRGVFVAVSGLWHDDLLSLYPGWWAMRLPRSSLISRKAEGRRLVSEVVLFSRRPMGLVSETDLTRIATHS